MLHPREHGGRVGGTEFNLETMLIHNIHMTIVQFMPQKGIFVMRKDTNHRLINLLYNEYNDDRSVNNLMYAVCFLHETFLIASDLSRKS